MFDTFLTETYRGCFVYQKYDTLLKRWVIEWSSHDRSVWRKPAKSWRAAQIQIARWTKQNQPARAAA
jgi:hypothetical protein